MERKKITKDIGKLEGPLLLFGGIYSNLQSLEKLIQISKELNIPNYNIICTGDVVAYCAQPEEVVQKIKDWEIHCIAGNVEIQLREGLEDCGCDFRNGSRCDIFSRNWYPYAQEKLSKDSINWMHDLPDFIKFEYHSKNCFVVHGSFFETSGYIFESTSQSEKIKNFEATRSNLLIGGHCGLPFSQKFDAKLWLNPGVIGMPANDGTSRVWYMILDINTDKTISYTHHTYHYDNITTSKLMIEENLPPEYAKTLITGIWDNCEILPREETLRQGVPIDFNF